MRTSWFGAPLVEVPEPRLDPPDERMGAETCETVHEQADIIEGAANVLRDLGLESAAADLATIATGIRLAAGPLPADEPEEDDR